MPQALRSAVSPCGRGDTALRWFSSTHHHSRRSQRRAAAMRELTGKVAVVTGGGGGIGKAMGLRFGQEGMKVVLSDIDEAGLDVAVKELVSQSIDATGVVADVSKLESVEALR